MSNRRGAALAALPLALALACSDATGPAPVSAHPLLVLRYTHLPEVWEYRGRTPRRIVLDSAGTLRDLAASADGRLAVSTLVADGSVDGGFVDAIIETTRDGRWLRTIERSQRPYGASHARGLAYSPDGQRLAWYVTYGRIDSLFVLDAGAATPRAIAQRATPFGQPVVRWTPSGRIAFEVDTALVTVDPATGAMTTAFTNPDSIIDFDFAADGRLAVATNPRTPPFGRLLAQRVPGGPMLPVVSAGETGGWVARWSPDGQRIATSGSVRVQEDGAVYERPAPVVLGLSGERYPVRAGPPGYFSIAGWTPDGRLVFLAYPASGSVEPSRRFDVFVALPGGRTANITSTPEAYESQVVIPP